MNQKNTYAYLLIGAVLLAGVAGYMMSDSAPTVDQSVPDETGLDTVVTVEDSNQEDSEIENGEMSNAS